MAALPLDGPIRILEVGGGTGATTQAILARLPQERIALYSFTDVAPGLVAKARGRFGENGWFAASTFDLEADAGAQGVGGDYDVIVAANVLHATRDLTRTLTRLRGLLRPGGSLVALEGAGPQGWIDLVFGMTKGWWAFEDGEARGGHPMPERDGWSALLKGAGFDAGLSGADAAGLLARQTVILARPSQALDWSVVGAHDDLSRGLAAALGGRELSLDALGIEAGPEAGAAVLVAPSPAATSIEEVAGALDILRLAALDAATDCSRMAIVTRGAFEGDMAAAAAWGLGRGIAAEYPQLRLLSIDIDAGMDDAEAASAVAEALACDDGEDQIRIGRTGRSVARLQAVEPRAAKPVALDPDGVHVVTGGFGGLGLASASRLVALGARKLLLIGRSPPSEAARKAIAQLLDDGATVLCKIADVARREEVDVIFAGLHERVAGVLHCAGSLDDRPLALLDAKSFAGLLGAKAGGCVNLERHCPDAAYFVVYSSAIGLVGAAGQANHIAANAMLDAFALRRREAGLPGASLAFAAWS
ncbi:MAG TPA: SDR family NAD(P)-dependent oxidoreductase, partial [Saliniramus sp.]|nr:SDR family NAD(P)-dependent oxidoreductase [Saliniramus sp.]